MERSVAATGRRYEGPSSGAARRVVAPYEGGVRRVDWGAEVEAGEPSPSPPAAAPPLPKGEARGRRFPGGLEVPGGAARRVVAPYEPQSAGAALSEAESAEIEAGTVRQPPNSLRQKSLHAGQRSFT